ncbi:Asp-tRNA(Asn)/Glu-tRNA(Gln) amidotransferase subunit GatC [Thermus oshimai]|uniref:Asp-tRNA(Asn)/Glu-tRNA(Gln) amidotransferase subunit GatC n=1 Tax=Thermus oshimai TaxID=56957 RepID=UPI00036DEE5F|nr:Asp-tRNA(Asn)/Glu-tRNA(Gln) amidotransferase subunit GatC [Thermus oshimai]
MELTPDLLRHLESLSKLKLSPEEEALLLQDLNRILAFVEALPEVEEGEEEPPTGRLRKDEPRPGLSQEEALALAPEREEGFFRVPKVLEW